MELTRLYIDEDGHVLETAMPHEEGGAWVESYEIYKRMAKSLMD